MVLNWCRAPFDGTGWCRRSHPELRARVDQASNIIMLAVFFLLWYVPVVNNFFWSVVGWIAVQLGIPLTAVTGFEPIPVLEMRGERRER